MKTYSKIVAACLIGGPIAAQQTLLVPSQYPTIQSAINAAANGDTITVAPGTYVESIDFSGKNVSVVGSSGPTATIIDGGSSAATVTFDQGESAAATLDGFTITHNYPTSIYGYGDRRGIFCSGASPTVRNCRITGNVVQGAGAGLFVHQGSITIERSLFANNIAVNGPPQGHAKGAAVYIDGYGASFTPMFVACQFVANEANDIDTNAATISEGGAVYEESNAQEIFRSCVFRANKCQDASGTPIGIAGAVLVFGTAEFANCTFTQNTSASATALWLHPNNYGATITNCIVWSDTIADPYDRASVSSSNIQGGWQGAGNIDSNPFFANPMAGDIHLLPGSPCIDAGTGVGISPSATDIDGETRIAGVAVDMGADEFHCAAIGSGQANGPTSRLEINGCGTGTVQGPFIVTTAPLQPLTFAWQGAPLMPMILISGPLRPTPYAVPGIGGLPGLGLVHLGFSPTYSDITVVFDGAHMSGGLQLTTSPTGTASQTVIVPAGTPPGTQIAVQGIVEQVAGTTTYGNLLTAAFRIDVQ